MIGEAAATGGIGAAVALAAIGVVASLARTSIGTWIREAIRLGPHKELEEHKSDLRVEENALLEEFRKLNAQLQAVQGTANATLIEGQRVAAEWRIKAVNDLWREMLRLRKGTPHLVFYVDIMQPSQYPQLWTNPKMRDVESYVDAQVKDLVGGSTAEDIEYIRPFLGEDVFANFFAYRAIFGRVAYVLQDGVKNRSLGNWFRDEDIREILLVVFSEEEMSTLEGLQSGHFSYMRNLLEEKILSDMRKVISGEVSTAEGLEQGRKILATVQRVDAETEYGRNLSE